MNRLSVTLLAFVAVAGCNRNQGTEEDLKTAFGT